MRDEHSHHQDDRTTNGDEQVNRSGPSDDHPPNGFTAVNGDGRCSSSFRTDESARPYVSLQTNGHDAAQHGTPVNGNYHMHGWRPDDRQQYEPSSRSSQRESSPARKRKRSISVNVENQDGHGRLVTDTEGRNSSKRRAASTLDSAIDLTSPVTNIEKVGITTLDRRQTEPAHIGPYARERSPVARWNQGEPPPQLRPETAALLAESASKFHQTEKDQEAQQNRLAEERQASSPITGTDQQEADASDEDETQVDSTDPKKQRKRNFSNRTKTGCHTCRQRKKKCDERKPYCGNCERGNFTCQGYGPKQPNGTKAGTTRHLHVQPKGYESGAYYQSPSDEPGRSYSHWGRVPPAEHVQPEHSRLWSEPDPHDHRYPPPSRDSWNRQGWPHASHSTASHFQDRLPPPDYPASQTPAYHWPSQPNLPPLAHQQHAQPSIPDPFAQYSLLTTDPAYNRQAARAPPTVSSSHSGSNQNQQHAQVHGPLTLATHQHSEKDKMLRGQPFLHWLDATLLGERDACALAVARFNDASRAGSGLKPDAKADLFAQILDPAKRPGAASQQKATGPSPVGNVKDHTIVVAPFTCDYGYNVRLGSASVLQAGCYLQDAAEISIGNRVIVGPEVKIYALTASVDCGARKGSQGTAVAGAVVVEDDVFIGAGAVILPYVTVGRGAVIGAGSVVTRDVKENTVVAGNPAKVIRTITPSAGVSPGLEVPFDRRYAYEIQEQTERVRKRMEDNARLGYNRHSPRLI